MGRTKEWLAAERPAMVAVLTEMERGYAREVGAGERGDLTLMLRSLSEVAAGMAGKPRSIPAMRQAWWRWTTDGPGAGTPQVQDLALMVRYAKHHRWLDGLKGSAAKALVDRLLLELEGIQATERRPLGLAWRPKAVRAVEGLVGYLEARIAERASVEGDGYWGAELPASLVVQAEVKVMVQEVMEAVARSLVAPRRVFEVFEDGDTLMQPFEGWPQALRDMAVMTASILNDAASEYEAFEAELIPAPEEDDRTPRRKKMFGAKERE